MDGRIRRWVPAVLAAVLVLGACTGLDDTFGAMGASVEGATMDGGESEGMEAGGDPGTATDVGTGGADATGPAASDRARVDPIAVQVLDRGRDIIFTADLTVAVADVTAAGDEAVAVVAGLGGFLFGQSSVGGLDPRSVITFKVPPSSFEEALARLGRIGEVRSQTVSSEDVTERVVDLESRIDTAAASVARLRALLDGATDIETIVALEGELLDRETQLESLRGSLRTLEEQVSLATIVVTITEAAANPAVHLGVTAYPTHDEGLSCPGSGSLAVEQGTEATICFEITNVGDTVLADIEVRDPVLDLGIDQLTLVRGTLDEPIEPGESVVLAAEILPDRDLRTRTTVSALGVGADGEPIEGRPASTTVGMFIDAVDPGGIPTFAEGLEASLDFLVDLAAVVAVVAGALLPFVWVPVAVWFGWRWWRRRRPAAPIRGTEPDREPDPEPEEVPAG